MTRVMVSSAFRAVEAISFCEEQSTEEDKGGKGSSLQVWPQWDQEVWEMVQFNWLSKFIPEESSRAGGEIAEFFASR